MPSVDLDFKESVFKESVKAYWIENYKYICHCENPIPLTFFFDFKFKNRLSGRGVISDSKCTKCNRIFSERLKATSEKYTTKSYYNTMTVKEIC